MTKKIYTNINEINFVKTPNEKYFSGYKDTSDQYKFRLTQHLLDLINRTDNEGLRKQFLPDSTEIEFKEDEFLDVADEKNYSPTLGIVHRYPNKVLLNVTLNCPTYCRFCFRKEKLNDNLQPKFLSESDLDRAFNYIKDKQIEEVIFSGGDPFFCSDNMIHDLVNKLNLLDHVNIVRYHTRYFTFDPARIDEKLISIINEKMASFIVLP